MSFTGENGSAWGTPSSQSRVDGKSRKAATFTIYHSPNRSVHKSREEKEEKQSASIINETSAVDDTKNKSTKPAPSALICARLFGFSLLFVDDSVRENVRKFALDMLFMFVASN